MMADTHSDDPDTATRFLIDQQMQEAMERSVGHGGTVWFVAKRMLECGCIQLVANFGQTYTVAMLRAMADSIEAGRLKYREGEFGYVPPPKRED